MESSAQAVIGGGASGDGKEMENQRKGGGRVDQSETEKKISREQRVGLLSVSRTDSLCIFAKIRHQ